MTKNILTLLAVSTFLTACSPQFIAGPEIALESHYKAKRNTQKGENIQPTTTWWANFGDSNLNRLVDEALEQNLSIEQARERVRAARYQARVSNGAYDPSVVADGSVIRQGQRNESRVKHNILVRRTKDTSTGGTLSANWKLDFFGAKSTREREEFTIEAQKADLYDARLQVIAAISNAYISAQGYGDQIAISRRTLSVQNNTSEITRAKLEAGSASALDNANALGQAALTSANIPALEQAREQSINQIAVLLGKEPAALDNLFSKYKPVKRPRVKFSEGIPADLLRNRPDIQAAELDLRASVSDIGVAEADLYPSLSLGGDLKASTASGLGASSFSFGPAISIPIFNRGTLHAQVDLRKSVAKQSYLTYKQTVLDAVREVEDALVAIRAERQQNNRLQVAVREYTRAEELAKQLNEAGNTEFNDVLDAQRQLYSAQLLLTQSSLQLSLNYIALCQALGGGWAGDEPVTASN